MNFDYPNGAMVLKAPWISAYTQGLVISALVRAWRLTNRPALRELLKSSAKVFELDVKDSGVRVSLDGHTLYTEIPGGPLPGIMDGFIPRKRSRKSVRSSARTWITRGFAGRKSAS